MNRQNRGIQISQRYVWIFAVFGLLVGVYLVYKLLTAGLQAYLALIAGVMILIGNAPELWRALQRREFGLAMMNSLIGLALIGYFFGTLIFPFIFWPISIIALALAFPLTLNRATIAASYIRGLQQLFGHVRQFARSRSRTY